AATSRWRTTSPLRATSDQTCLLQSIQKTKEIGLVGKSDFLRLRRRATTFRVCSRRRPSSPLLLWPPEIDGLCPRFPADYSGRKQVFTFARLLDFHLGAGVFELLAGGFGFGLRNAFLDGLRRAVDEVLRFLETEARQLTHRLDHVDLVVAERVQHDGEFGLLLDRGGGRATGGWRCDRNGGGGGHAELVFHRLDELGELENGHRRDFVEDFSLNSGHSMLLT